MPDFDPKKPFKVTFVGESGVDDGGPKREFCKLLMGGIKSYGVLEGPENRACFSHDMHFLTANKYFVAGRFVALSICHGGPGLQCLSRATYQYMAKGCVVDTIDINDIPDYEVQQVAKQVSILVKIAG